MLTVTKAAAKQVKHAALQAQVEEPALRIAVRKQDNGALEYVMGFDEVGPQDVLIGTGGIDIVIAEADKPLLQGTTIDFVEYETGEHRFIFMNPNDPHYIAPQES